MAALDLNLDVTAALESESKLACRLGELTVSRYDLLRTRGEIPLSCRVNCVTQASWLNEWLSLGSRGDGSC